MDLFIYIFFINKKYNKIRILMFIFKVQYFVQMLITEKGERIMDPIFKFSLGWVNKFRERHGIQFKILDWEEDCDPYLILKHWNDLKEITKQFKPRDIFNSEKFAIFYKLLPYKNVSDKSCKDEKSMKTKLDRITAMLCCNSDCSEKNKTFS